MNAKTRIIVTCILGLSLLISGCSAGQIFGPTSTPAPTPTPNPQAENGTWQVRVASVSTSPASLLDANGSSVSPNSGYQWLVVSTKLVNVSSNFQELWVGIDGLKHATLKDSDGNLLRVCLFAGQTKSSRKSMA